MSLIRELSLVILRKVIPELKEYHTVIIRVFLMEDESLIGLG